MATNPLQPAIPQPGARWPLLWCLLIIALHLPFVVFLPLWPFLLITLGLAGALRRHPAGPVFAVTACTWLGISAARFLNLGYPWYNLLPLLLMLGWQRRKGARTVWLGVPTKAKDYLLAVSISLAAACVLYLWLGQHPEAQSNLRQMLPPWSPPGLVGLAFLFALFNAWLEEGLFRWFYQRTLQPLIGTVPAILLQGALFGALHVIGGVPSGLFGGVLAGLFGVAMGALAHRYGSLRLPILAHAGADLAIMLTVVLAPTA